MSLILAQVLPLILVGYVNSQRLVQPCQRLPILLSIRSHIPTPSSPTTHSVHHSASPRPSSFCSEITASCPAQDVSISGLKASPSILPSYPFYDPHTLSAVINGMNIRVPSRRFPAGIYISINVNSWRRWKSAIRVLSSDGSVAWGNTVTL
jgi:hypothetical protein